MVPFEMMTLERFGRWPFATRRRIPRHGRLLLVAVLDDLRPKVRRLGWGPDEPRWGPSAKGSFLESVSIRRTTAR